MLECLLAGLLSYCTDTRFAGKDPTLMSRFNMAIWALAVLLLTWLIPVNGFTVERDPYMMQTWTGRVFFELEKSVTERTGERQENNRFLQKYNLDIKGNYKSSKLLIYDLGIGLLKEDNKSNTSKFGTRLIEYSARTTVLPKSAIPLTLYALRQQNSSNTAGSATISSNYGLNWFERIKGLPQVSVSADRGNTTGKNIDLETTNYSIDVQKKMGPTENDVTYSKSESINSAGNSSSSTSTWNLRNRTHISKATEVDAGFTRGAMNSSSTHQSTVQGLTLGLQSNPSDNFSQTHNYSYFSNRSLGTQTGSTYSGNLRYRFSNRLNSQISLDSTHNKNETPTSTSDSDHLATNGHLTFAMSKSTNLTQSVSYSEFQQNARTSPNDITKRSTFRETTTISYGTDIKWALLSAAYGLGFVDDRAQVVERGGGKGIEQSASLGLNNINFNRYVGFNTSAKYTYTENLTGNISGWTKYFHFDTFNKEGRQYVLLNAAFNKTAQSSWLNMLEQRVETYTGSASTNYFSNTALSAHADHSNSFSQNGGFSTNASQSVSANHERELLGGAISGNVSFSTGKSKYAGTIQRTDTTNYTLVYARELLRNMPWRISYQKTDTDTNDVKSKVTTVQNALFYPLRQWLVSLDHRYTVSDDSLRKQKETRVDLKITRTFLLVRR